jgi:hypothetical protein
MTWNWKFDIGAPVNFTNEHGSFTGIVAARAMSGQKVHDTPMYSIRVQTWDGGTWSGGYLTPLAQELEKQNP